MKRSILLAGMLVSSLVLWGANRNGDQLTIAGIVVQNDLFMRIAQLGMERAGKDFGVNVLLANSDNKIDKESQLIDTYIARAVDAIVLMPLSATASQAAIRRARAKGIEIILANTSVEDSSLYSSFLATENSVIGDASGKAALSYIKDNMQSAKQINVATIAFKAQFPEASDARVNGFLDQVKKDPRVRVVSQQDAWLAEQAIATVGDILTANPSLDIIYAANEGGTVGATQAVKNSGRKGKAVVFGTDGSEQISQLLLSDDDILQFAAAQKPFDLGYKGVEIALSVLKGEGVEKEIIVPVRGLDRNDKAEINAFMEELKSY